MSIRRDFVPLNASIADIDEGLKNRWKWDWLHEVYDGNKFARFFEKLKIAGKAYCRLCRSEISYKSGGKRALVDHLKGKQHNDRLRTSNENFRLSENDRKIPVPHTSLRLNAHPDNAKYYTSCHYASAPVMPRPSETTLCGNRTETHILNGKCSHQLSPYHQQHEHHPLVTPQHLPHCSHTHLTPLLVNVNGQTSVLRQGDLPLPPSRSILSYRRLEGGGPEYTSSSAASQTNSDRSHTYESIGDGHLNDGLKNGVVVGGGVAGHSAGLGYVNQFPRGDPRRATPDFCDCECAAHLELDPINGHLDGYYSDRSTQTLPVRHFRHVIRDTESPFGGPYCFDIEDSPHGTRPDSRLSNRSRRRTSSGSHYSDRSFGGYREGQKRNIPALHPNYFDPPEPPAPDTFTS